MHEDRRYEYYLLGGAVPVRVILNEKGFKLGAETPDADSGKLIIKNVLLSRLETSEEVEEIGQREFEGLCAEILDRKTGSG